VFGIEATEVIEKTAKRYEKMNSFYATFTQVFCDETSGTCQEFEGEIYFLRPNFFRMEIKKPAQVYVGDSSSLWIYLPEKNRAIKQTLSNVPFQINPDIFLKDYQKKFRYTIDESESIFSLFLLPKDETEIYQRILIKIDKKKFEIREISIQDEIGSENKFIFEKVKINKSLSKKIFQFNPPEGCDVIEQ
jgi:outer membrane lipoprotein carrier protein